MVDSLCDEKPSVIGGLFKSEVALSLRCVERDGGSEEFVELLCKIEPSFEEGWFEEDGETLIDS